MMVEGQKITKTHKAILVFFVAALLGASVYAFLAPSKTDAVALNPPDPSGAVLDPQPVGGNAMPAANLNSLNADCQVWPPRTPAFTQWVSINGNPASTSITVPSGTPYIDLEYHSTGVVCWNFSNVEETRFPIINAWSSVPGSVTGFAINNPNILNFSLNVNQEGALRHDYKSFRFTPVGGFTTSGSYFINIETKPVSYFSSVEYYCAAPPGSQIPGWLFFMSCPSDIPNFEIVVNVQQSDWDYEPIIAENAPPDNSSVAPGDVVSVDGEIRNLGPANGSPYNFRLKPENASTPYVELVNNSWSPGGNAFSFYTEPSVPQQGVQWGAQDYPSGTGYPGIGAGNWSGVVRSAQWRIRPGTPHGTVVCFLSLASNHNRFANGSDYEASNRRICFTVRHPWELTNETASIDGSSSPGCAVAYAGATINFGSTIQNVGSVPVQDQFGDLADVRINESIPSNISAQTLTRISGTNSINNVAIGPGATYSLPGNQYRVPATAQVGETFVLEIAYLQTANSPSATPASPEARFYGLYQAWPSNISPGPRKATACVEIVDFAYMKVHGSGVHNGGVWDTLAQCRNVPHSIAATSDLESRILGGIGTSAEYGATSLKSEVSGFASAIIFNQNIGNQERLTFANSDDENGNFLGAATSPAKCLADLYRELDGPVGSRSLAQIAANSAYGASEDVSKAAYLSKLNGAVSGLSNYSGKAVILVDGDMSVEGDVSYAATYGDYASGVKIPSLVFIVKGDIVINQNVSNLDGMYMAIPRDDGSGGKIITCNQTSGNQINNPCGATQLTVNGAFISSDVDFYRFIYGRQYAAAQAGGGQPQDGFASEIFNFSPELYMANPFSGLINFNDLSNQEFDYYKERAPVY